MAQFGEKIWFHKIGEEGIYSFVKRIIQGMFAGHHDRTGTISYMTKSGIVRGKSRTKQTLSDAWESTNLEDLFDNPLHMVVRSHMVITETRLTKKFITDEEGAGLLLPRIMAEKPPEVERRRFYVCVCGNFEAHGHMGSCPGYAHCLHRREKRQNHGEMNSESDSERLLKKP